jgi:hypothetical protein
MLVQMWTRWQRWAQQAWRQQLQVALLALQRQLMRLRLGVWGRMRLAMLQ